MRTLSSLSCDTRAVFPHSPLVLLISPEWDTFHTTHSWGEWTLGFVVWDSLGTSEELPDKIRDMELDVNFRSTKKKKKSLLECQYVLHVIFFKSTAHAICRTFYTQVMLCVSEDHI